MVWIKYFLNCSYPGLIYLRHLFLSRRICLNMILLMEYSREPSGLSMIPPWKLMGSRLKYWVKGIVWHTSLWKYKIITRHTMTGEINASISYLVIFKHLWELGDTIFWSYFYFFQGSSWYPLGWLQCWLCCWIFWGFHNSWEGVGA